MKKLLVVVGLMGISVFSSACSNLIKTKEQSVYKEIKTEGKEENTLKSEEIILPVARTKNTTDIMKERSRLGDGNLARLANAMKKARQKEEVTIGFIGGSITEGYSSTKHENSYAYQTYEWWVKAFPETKINYVNAGIGATNSYLGVHRVNDHLLQYKPDVVVIEYSVNDSDTMFFKESYEDLVRKILSEDYNPAVILLFNTMEDGTSAQASHLHVGFYLEVPRISYREAVLTEIKENRLTWAEISPDNIHPSDKGHGIIAELMYDFFNDVLGSLDSIHDKVVEVNETPLFVNRYKDGTILDNTLIEPIQYGSFNKSSVFERFKNNWSTKDGSESIIFQVEAMNIGIMFYRTTDGKTGSYDVYIDGEYTKTLDGDFLGGWGNYAETIEVFRSKEKKIHTIEIRRTEKSKGEEFHILSLLVS